jgi:proline iminopeptidase
VTPVIPKPRESGYTGSTAVPLYWVRYGPADSGPVLLLHGGPGAEHEYLLPQRLAIGAGRRGLVTYDQRGGGRSRSDDRTPVTWRTQVEDLGRIVAELGIAPLDIVGYSWGGLLAMLYAIEAAAGRVTPAPRRLVLVDPAPVTRAYRDQFEGEFNRRQMSDRIRGQRTKLAESGLRDSDPEGYKQRAFELSVAGYFADPDKSRDLTPFRVVGRVQQSIWESLGDFDLTAPGQLDTVRVPTLIIHGRQDPIPVASSEAAAKSLGARLVILDQCGHVPYVEQPDQLFAAINAFLAEP